jgi:hypothetical protein
VKTDIVSLTGSLEHTAERQTDDTVDNEGTTDILATVGQDDEEYLAYPLKTHIRHHIK